MITRLPKFSFAFLLLIASFTASAGGPYTIPVVFHVLHQGGPENISDTLINKTLEWVNYDYNRQNVDTMAVDSAFKNNIADMQIAFCLAHTDPNGSPTMGIDRIFTPLTDYGDSDAVKINQWPNEKYLNIWIVKNMGASSALGTATMPAAAAVDPSLDGLVTHYSLYNSPGSAFGSRGVTYFIGKYLNLYPTGGYAACGDDSVADTPPTAVVSGCNTSQSSCNPGVIENVQNFMSWSSCHMMFTNGQKQRVYETLDTANGGRKNLSKPANLAVTCSAPTGIHESRDGKITVSPNPFDQVITITGLDDGIQDVSIYDITGRIVWSKRDMIVSQKSIRIDLSAISAGMYEITIKQDAMLQILKLIKEK
ncbi:MAG: hypothetical protein JWO03_3011 [Bacteroidetes bacterium]|nr:hypothetical protein [Bacteroidota bacterium]